jgi:RNA polymerase sigma-70 factor, ECF subfamily
VTARSEEPELELLVDESTGDDSALSGVIADRDFEPFYRAQYPKVVRLLVGLTGRRALAEELAQEALLSAHKRWAHLATMDRPDLWLRRVAINRAISAHRRWLAEVAALARVRSREQGATQAPSDAGLAADERLWNEIRALPRRQASALVLWAVEDLALDDVGEVLGCAGETARTHLRRARERLAAALGDDVAKGDRS